MQALVMGGALGGFPSGWAGVAMAAAWGLALRVIRVCSAGLLAPYLVQVSANSVIGIRALMVLR